MDDAKLLLAALNDVLTALYGSHLQACQCKRAGGGKGCLIEPTGSVTASIAALSTTLPGESNAHG